MHDPLECPFIFLPDGTPLPADWAAAHPDHLVLPARLDGTPSNDGRDRNPTQPDATPYAKI